MNITDYHNHSGGAIGSDSMWDEIGREFGVINHHHYWYGRMNPKSNVLDELTKEEFEEGKLMVYQANKKLFRKPEKYINLLARNWLQVKNSEAIFAIGTIKGNKVDGGTGWAVQMAIDNNKEVYVFDQEINKWFEWNNKFIPYLYTPILTKNFAGIGTREINENGINAIRNVYRKTFNIK